MNGIQKRSSLQDFWVDELESDLSSKLFKSIKKQLQAISTKFVCEKNSTKINTIQTKIFKN